MSIPSPRSLKQGCSEHILIHLFLIESFRLQCLLVLTMSNPSNPSSRTKWVGKTLQQSNIVMGNAHFTGMIINATNCECPDCQIGLPLVLPLQWRLCRHAASRKTHRRDRVHRWRLRKTIAELVKPREDPWLPMFRVAPSSCRGSASCCWSFGYGIKTADFPLAASCSYPLNVTRKKLDAGM